MFFHWKLALCGLVLAAGALAQAQPAGLSTAHDGTWAVNLVCPDLTDKTGLVKGYEYRFTVAIAGGRVEGQYGRLGSPSSVVYSGVVREGGALELAASGTTGPSEFAVGKVAKGTSYAYTLKGRLGPVSGQAERQEARKCTAHFSRQ